MFGKSKNRKRKGQKAYDAYLAKHRRPIEEEKKEILTYGQKHHMSEKWVQDQLEALTRLRGKM